MSSLVCLFIVLYTKPTRVAGIAYLGAYSVEASVHHAEVDSECVQLIIQFLLLLVVLYIFLNNNQDSNS